MPMACIQGFVSGKVQGVWFRASAQTRAEQLGIKGWVRNTPDGRVELVACGEPDVLHVFQNWLAIGPDGAEVTRVEVKNYPISDLEGFIIKS